MGADLFSVKALIKSHGKTVAVDVLDLDSGSVMRVQREDFPMLRGKLNNAIVSGYIIRAKSGHLPVIASVVPAGHVKGYTIMYEDVPVLTVQRASGDVAVHRKKLLPFGLRGVHPLDASVVLHWIERRVSNISRKYMNLVYVARGVGRDTLKVLQDSCGVSITDNFWIKTSDVSVTWSDLRDLRDVSTSLSKVALTGELKGSDLSKGFTSLFSLRGYYPKAILNGHMYKLQSDAMSDYLASYIGEQLGISVQSSRLVNDLVEIDLFTSASRSLVHAREVKAFYGGDVDLFRVFTMLGRFDLVSQLQRLFIFNYVIGNLDLHDENYGFLYDASTFEILSVSPCYDHNLALVADEGVLMVHSGIAAKFDEIRSVACSVIGFHPDIVERLRCLDLGPIRKYLSEEQMAALRGRIDVLLSVC